MDDLANYRPISLLPLLNKILEKHIIKHLLDFVEASGCLDPSQSGFRPRHSTETALISVTDNIRQSLDNGQAVLLVLLDLSAAFDTVSHQIMVRRLREISIQGTALQWMLSFLSHRTQTINLGPFHSETVELTKGEP